MPRGAPTSRQVVVRQASDDPYRRVFWIVVAFALSLTGGGIISYFAMWKDNAAALAIGQTERKTLAADIAQLKADQPRLAEMGRTLAETSTKIDLMMAGVAELRSQMTIFASDRYTVSQATSDRTAITKTVADMMQAITGRVERLEETQKSLMEFRARMEERTKAAADEGDGKH